MNTIEERYINLLKTPQDQVLLNNIEGGIFALRFNDLYDLHSTICKKYNTILNKEITLPKYPTAEQIMHFRQISNNLALTLRLLELLRWELHDKLTVLEKLKNEAHYG